MNSLSQFDRDMKYLMRTLGKISDVAAPKAFSSALNKTGAKIRTAVIKEVSKDIDVPQKVIKKKAYFNKARANKLEGKLNMYRRSISAASIGKVRKMGRGVRGTGVQIRGHKYSGAFLAVGRAGKIDRQGRLLIFKRKTRNRLPLEVKRIEIKKEVASAMKKHVQRLMMSDFPRILDHELKWEIMKHVKKGRY